MQHHTLMHHRNKCKSSTSTARQDITIRIANRHNDAINCTSNAKTWKSTRNHPNLKINISYGNHVVHAYAMLVCASKLTLLKLSSSLQLELDLMLNDRIQLKQALSLSDTASAKMTIAIGPYKHRQQPFQINKIDVMMD